MQKRKNIGRELPVSLGLFRHRVRGGESDRAGGGLVEEQPATMSPSASIPANPSFFIIVVKISTRLDSLRVPV